MESSTEIYNEFISRSRGEKLDEWNDKNLDLQEDASAPNLNNQGIQQRTIISHSKP